MKLLVSVVYADRDRNKNYCYTGEFASHDEAYRDWWEKNRPIKHRLYVKPLKVTTEELSNLQEHLLLTQNEGAE